MGSKGCKINYSINQYVFISSSFCSRQCESPTVGLHDYNGYNCDAVQRMPKMFCTSRNFCAWIILIIHTVRHGYISHQKAAAYNSFNMAEATNGISGNAGNRLCNNTNSRIIIKVTKDMQIGRDNLKARNYSLIGWYDSRCLENNIKQTM